ncbi:MAG: hypothetical protein HC875_29460 [Anaerolineales bacterium]|nr:hypothetical protein [Anaerolineales bacterium]
MMFSRDERQGMVGEWYVYQQLVKRGWSVKMMADFYHKNCDMKVGQLPIEVKYAKTTYRKKQRQGLNIYVARWQWFVHSSAQEMNDRDWVLVLIAEDQKKIKHPYILPGNLLDGRNHLQITSHPNKYTGWLNDWKGEWQVIEFLMQQSYLDNGPTYHQWKQGQRIVA